MLALHLRVPHIDADVLSGHQSPEPGDAGARDARPDHPKLGVHEQVIAGVAMDVGRHDDFLAILRHANVGHFADLHVFVADLGLIGLQALGIMESNLDGRALRQFFVNDDEGAGEHHDGGQYPHQGNAPPTRIGGNRFRQFVQISTR